MKHQIPVEVVSMQGDGFHVFLQAWVGRKKIRLLLDTGASRTVFDETRLNELLPKADLELLSELSTGLGTNSLSGKSTQIGTFRIGELRIRNYPAIVLDLAHVNQTYQRIGLPLLDGVLGSDILKEYQAVIDYKHELLVLENSRREQV